MTAAKSPIVRRPPVARGRGVGAYLAQRKHEAYRSAAEVALQNGDISERERAILEGLQASLDVTAEALRIEREVEIALQTRAEAVVAVV